MATQFLNNVSLVNKIKVFTTLTTPVPDTPLNASSFLNKKDALMFLLDIISLVLGSRFLRIVVSGMLNNLLPTLDVKIKTLLKSTNVTHNSNTKVNNFNINNIPMSLLDYNDQFKVNPNSVEGSQSLAPGTFNGDFYSNVLNKPNTTQNFFGGSMGIGYNSSTNGVNIGSSNVQGTKTNYLNNLLSNMTIVDPKSVTNMAMDALFNTVSKKKSLTGINNDLAIDGIINKILQEENENDSFSISIEDVSNYEVQARAIKAGNMVLDFGCDTALVSLDRDFLNQTFVDPILQLDGALNNALTNSNVAPSPAISDNFYKSASSKMMLAIIKSVILSPQSILYIINRTSLLNGSVNIPNNPTDLLKQEYALVRTIICYLKNQIVEFVYGIFKREIYKVVLPVLKQVIKEKILSYKNIMLSLVK